MVRALGLCAAGAPLWAFAQAAANAPQPAAGAPPIQRTSFGSGSTSVALLLPAADGAFARARGALLAGVQAAHGRDGEGIRVEVFDVADQADELAAVAGELRERGFSFAIGPLTRNGATALLEVGGVAVPTLALNLPDGSAPVPQRVVFFALATELEAGQVAELAFAGALARATGRAPRAAIASADTPLARRSATAFQRSWAALGGQSRDVITVTTTRGVREWRSRLGTPTPDVLFLAMSAEQARALRAAAPADTAVWSTSLASIGNAAQLRLPELDGLKLVDMPWQVEQDHPAVMSYPQSPAGFNVEMQRLYALGIDAFRVARQLMSGGAAFELDGVTGRLSYDPAGVPRVARTAVAAEYRNGAPVALPGR